jgi:hypothetical protein
MTLIWGNIDHCRFASISHDVYLAHILPFIPQNDLEELVLRAVETNNIEDLYFLIGTTRATVPKYLSSNYLSKHWSRHFLYRLSPRRIQNNILLRG